MQPVRFGPRLRYLPTNSTQTAFGQIVPGNAVAFAGANAASHKVFLLGDARGMIMRFFGTGTDNTTFDYRVWGLNIIDETESPSDFIAEYYGGGTVTLTANTGAATDTIVTSSDQYADALTFTLATTLTSPAGPATVFQTAFDLGDATVYSPADDTNIAALCIPNFPFRACVVEFDLTGATSANCEIQRTL